ncbi:MAG: hypothetical protein GF392_03180 [Candidatus Omnitrophica bacterium]|nr:hypothetical protein [Candidatus Omnitrophota bacterium]
MDNIFRKTKIFRALLPAALFTMIFLSPRECSSEGTFEISLSKSRVRPGGQSRLILYLPGEDAPLPDVAGVLKGLEVNYRGMSLNPGPGGIVAEHTYSLSASSPGVHTIGPFEFDRKGERYVSNSLELTVAEIPSEREDPGRAAEKQLRSRIFMEVDIPSKVYINELFRVEVEFYTDWLDIEDLNVYDEPGGNYINEKYISGKTVFREKGGKKFAVLSFFKEIFIPQAGNISFGPVRAVFRIAKSRGDTLNPDTGFYADLLGKRERREFQLEEGPFYLRVLPLPAEGRPGVFNGAVGDYEMRVDAGEPELEVGDMTGLEIVITGTGNLSTLTAPSVEKTAGFTVLEPSVERTDRGIIVEQPLRAMSSAASRLPEVNFSFFDPSSEKYRELKSSEIPVEVKARPGESRKAAPDIAEAPDAGEKEQMTLRPVSGPFRKKGKFIFNSGAVYLLWGGPLALLLSTAAVKKRIDKFREDPEYAAWYYASRKARKQLAGAKNFLDKKDAAGFYAAVFDILQDYMGERLMAEKGSITMREVKEKALKSRDDEGIRYQAERLFENCYAAKFAASGAGEEEMRGTFSELKGLIMELDKRKRLL